MTIKVKTGGCDLQRGQSEKWKQGRGRGVPVQVVLSSTIRQESVRIDQVHKVGEEVVRVAVELGLEETFQDPERVPVVDLCVRECVLALRWRKRGRARRTSVTTTGDNDAVVQWDHRGFTVGTVADRGLVGLTNIQQPSASSRGTWRNSIVQTYRINNVQYP